MRGVCFSGLLRLRSGYRLATTPDLVAAGGRAIVLLANICLIRANLFTAESAESTEIFSVFLRELGVLCGYVFGCGWKPRYVILAVMPGTVQAWR